MTEVSGFQKFINGLTRFFRHIFVYLPPFIGAGIIILTGDNILFPNYKALNKIAETFGVVLLTGGLLSLAFSILKYFKYFQNVLADILYGREFLEKRSDLNILWSNITSILYHRKFPKIANKIQSLLKDNYFDLKNPFYSSFAEVKITYKHEKDSWFIVTDVIDQKIVASTEVEFTVPMASDLDFSEAEEAESYNKLLYFYVNGEELYHYEEEDSREITRDIKGARLIITPFSQKNRKGLKFTLTLSGKTEYHTIRVIEKRYNLIYNPLKSWIASHIYRRLSVFVSYPEDLINLTYRGCGTVYNFDPVLTGNLCNTQLVYNNILLPNQGIVFGVSQKKV